MLFDTHCHLNFKIFENRIDQIIKSAGESGVNKIIVPGTDIDSSLKAIKIAEKYNGVYAAVGIHPHHAIKQDNKILLQLEKLLTNKKVVAIGEVGIDKHIYKKTKYKDYKIDSNFIEYQKTLFIEQIKLAKKYKKSLIIHNREAKAEVIDILTTYSSFINPHSSVFHCCEPDEELLIFAKNHNMFIGVDGDVCYWKEKQEFVKKLPLEMLVLETDSPFLSPFRKFPNEPKNISFIAEFISKLKSIPIDQLSKITTENAKRLFSI